MQASSPTMAAALVVIGVIVGGGLVFGTLYAAGSLTPRTTTGTTTQTVTTTGTTTGTLTTIQTVTTTFATTVSGSVAGTVLDQLIGQPVSQLVYSSLYQTSNAPYGASDSAYRADVRELTGPLLSTNGKPIIVWVGAEYCMYCAMQRWPLMMALMRFGNFTNLEYMTSSVAENDYATFTFASSSHQSNYVVFQPYEVYDRTGNPLAILPTNYTSTWQQYGKSSYPFLNFADEHLVLGSMLNPALLGMKNWTQVVSSIQDGDALGSQIKQAANVITAVICETTGNSPASVCDQSSITALMITTSMTEPVLYARVNTTLGSFDVELFNSLTPETVANFVNLVNQGFYNNLVWHRITQGFVIQTGDPTTRNGGGNRADWGDNSSDVYIPFEYAPSPSNDEYYLGMASTGAGVGGSSQFYINLANNTSLDGSYAVFGKVISGFSVVQVLGNVPVETVGNAADEPVTPVYVTSITMISGP